MLEQLTALNERHDEVDASVLSKHCLHGDHERVLDLEQDQLLDLQRLKRVVLEDDVFANALHRVRFVVELVLHQVNFAKRATANQLDNFVVFKRVGDIVLLEQTHTSFPTVRVLFIVVFLDNALASTVGLLLVLEVGKEVIAFLDLQVCHLVLHSVLGYQVLFVDARQVQRHLGVALLDVFLSGHEVRQVGNFADAEDLQVLLLQRQVGCLEDVHELGESKRW